MEFAGEFETHITVRAESDDVAAIRAWGDRHGLTSHHIVLDRGQTPSQPMIGRRGRGHLSGEIAAAAELVRRLADAGFAACRVKIEAAPGNQDVPVTDDEAIASHAGRHFEHHIKLLLESDANLTPLAELAIAHNAHLSRNALRVRDDGRRERFVTQRCHAVGRMTAQARLDALQAALAANAYMVLSVEVEYVVYDSDPGIDAGWLDS